MILYTFVRLSFFLKKKDTELVVQIILFLFFNTKSPQSPLRGFYFRLASVACRMLILHSSIALFIFANLIEEKSLKHVLWILYCKISKVGSFFSMKSRSPFLWPTSRVSGNGPQEFSPSSDSTDIFHENKPRAVTSIESEDHKFCLSRTATQHARGSGSRDTRDTSRSWKEDGLERVICPRALTIHNVTKPR